MTGRALATFELNAWLSPVVSPAVLADQLPPSATILEQRPLPRGTEGSRVVGRLRATMLIIDSFLLVGTELTPDLLPGFLHHAFGPELSAAEEEAERARLQHVTFERRRQHELQDWSALNWLYWLTTENRAWWIVPSYGPEAIDIVVVVTDSPTPLDSLEFLLHAASRDD